jgi:hypothetical protein
MCHLDNGGSGNLSNFGLVLSSRSTGEMAFLTTEQLSDLQKTLLAAVGSSAATDLSPKGLGDKSDSGSSIPN